MTQKGLLLVISEPPPGFEEEFNAWYDSDHIPERLAIPGFETGLRFVSADRARRYLALYDLARIDILETSAYLAFAGANFTPWSKRVVARCRIDRIAAIQTFPGDEVTVTASRLLLMRLTQATPQSAEALMRASFEGRLGVEQVRVFTDQGTKCLHVLVCGHGDLAGIIDYRAASLQNIRIEVVETYLPY